MIDFTKKTTAVELNNRYRGINILLNNIKFKVHKIEEVRRGVKIYVQDREIRKIATISQNGKDKIFRFKECEDALFELRE